MDPTSPTLAVVVTGGDRPDPDRVASLDLPVDGRVVVAADSGIGHALELGLPVDVAVGDFDSVDPATLSRVEAAGTRVERHPPAKDETDLELALDVALGLGVRRVVVLGGHGGRLDHFLANVALLCTPRLAGVEVEALVGDAVVRVLRPGRDVLVHGRPGELVSILPALGDAGGVRTEGLRWPLRREHLPAGTSRGVSNELVDPVARIGLDAGVALVVRPCPHPDSRRPPSPSDPATEPRAGDT